ncbi:TspO/MBR family protein [Wenzhouxiangella marina]|uniref:Protein crtK n=1 Tax=Wenzhouxiangella marina TaxID=1579979 RepID=A0A0K0XSJ5_9GAMM|nr:TspO/MBR family protein [Wenzhouxiangella marina]AKS40596.1 Protein crtK [Wenzhouxiangella marina]MBB6088364.1 tryptophan-rich sensory protein [Wenzhouxiangella marina]
MNTTESRPGPLAASAMLVLFLLLSFSAAATGYFFPPGEWYASLNRPSFAPPNWLFGPVWTTLYVLIAVSGWMIWKRAGWRSPLLALWLVQMGLNALWTPLFFGMHLLGWALIEMGLLWIAIAACVMRFRPASTTASWLLMPYLAWVSFAFALNLGFWWLN